MLKRHPFVRSLWGWLKCVRGGVRRSPCYAIKSRNELGHTCLGPFGGWSDQILIRRTKLPLEIMGNIWWNEP